MVGIDHDAMLAEPFAEAFAEDGVVEVLAPERGEFYAGLVEAAVEVEHADQAGPLA